MTERKINTSLSDEAFCQELELLSRKYGIVIQAIGGVIRNTDGVQGYNTDLNSGDLMPVWEHQNA